jgi:hypothetical protein
VLGIALEAGLQREWRVQLFFDLLDRAHHLPDRGAGLQIERDRHRRELALMVDDERRDLHDAVDQRGERYLLSGR